MDGSTWILIAGLASITIGFVLTIIFGEKALNKSFSPGSDHGLFWGGIVALVGGFGFLIIYIFLKISRINSLNQENRGLYSKINSLQEQLGQCKGVSFSGQTSSGPGFFSRIGSRIGGFFSRSSSVPAAGNPGE
jgi:hypothetical protein